MKSCVATCGLPHHAARLHCCAFVGVKVLGSIGCHLSHRAHSVCSHEAVRSQRLIVQLYGSSDLVKCSLLAMLWQDDAMFRTYAVAESPLLSRPDKPERTTPYYDRRHYGGRQHYVHGAAMAIPVVTMVSLLIVTACSAPQRLQVQQASGCDANGNIYLAIDPRPTTWNPDYLFAITVGFGAYDYMTAKIIDVIWDVLVSRCGQVVAGMLVYRVFRKVMLLRMEDGPEPYEMFANVANRTTSIEALVTYVRQWGVWDAKAWVRPRSQQWRWRWAFAAVALTYTTAYTLALPTVASAMTGYQTNNVAMMFLENGSSVEVSQITMYAGVIRDASRIGYLDPYIPLTGELNYAIRNCKAPFQVQDFGQHMWC